MDGPEIPSLKERTAGRLEHPDTLDTIVGHIAEGGTLIQLCRTWDVRFSDVFKWIRADEARAEEYQAALDAREEWTVDAILTELRCMATVDIRKAFSDDDTLLPMSQIPDDVAKALKSVQVDDLFDGYGKDKERIGRTAKAQFWDKQKALELWGRTLEKRRLFVEKHEVEHKVPLEELVAGPPKKK